MVKKITNITGATVLILFGLICLKEGTFRRTAAGFEVSKPALERAFNKGIARPIGGMAEEVSPPRSERK